MSEHSPEHLHRPSQHNIGAAQEHSVTQGTHNLEISVPATHTTTHDPRQDTEPTQKPSVGRIVHYVIDSGQSKGQHRPGIITRVWSDTCVQLTVFTDWSNDFGTDQHGGGGILWRPSVALDHTGEKPGTFHWPERV